MNRETKIGLAMALVLVGVFGFLVYKRFVRPQDGVAQTQAEASEDGAAPDSNNETPQQPDAFLAENDEQEPEILPVAATARQIPDESSGSVDDPFGESTAVATSKKTPTNRPKLPTLIPDTDEEADGPRDEFAADEAAATPGKSSGRSAVRLAAPEMNDNDPFTESPEVAASSDDADSAPSMSFEDEATSEAEETFVVDAPPSRGRSSAGGGLSETRTTPNKATSDSFGTEETVSIQARTKLPEPSILEDASEMSDEAPELLIEPSGSDRVAAEPSELTFGDDRYGGYEPIHFVEGRDETGVVRAGGKRDQIDYFDAADDRRVPVSISGDKHVVQPGENFWTISQKKYGTGRYFQALAAHNHRAIPDATKMKTGVTISLPPEEELLRRYGNLIPKPGPAEPAAADVRAEQPGEFLLGADGKPLYRIGARDTLSGIAQKYLGRSSRWVQIFEMNRDVLKDGNTLKVGVVLRLPADAGDGQVSNQPRVFR